MNALDAVLIMVSIVAGIGAAMYYFAPEKEPKKHKHKKA
jgi:hypothetical protein